MKKVLVFIWCISIVFLSTACRESDSDLEAGLSSVIYSDESETDSEDASNESENVSDDKDGDSSLSKNNSSNTKDKGKTSSAKSLSSVVNSVEKTSSKAQTSSADKGKTSSVKSSSSAVNSVEKTSSKVQMSSADKGESSSTKQTSSKVTTSSATERSYKELTCVKILSFKKVGFSVSQSNKALHIMMPDSWSLKENKNGYSILKNEKEIGSVTAYDDYGPANEGTNVYYDTTYASGVDIYHSIDRTDSNEGAVYTRTISYYYEENDGNGRTIAIKVPYQEIDNSAVWTMMTDVTASLSSTEPNIGTLPISDNRNKILILGNSFIGTSKIGSILQTMCGSEMVVEAQSRGYARVTTYVQDTYVMDSIRGGNYSAVFLCGLYDSDSLINLEYIVEACRTSNTRLVVFPAHNEPRANINSAQARYPDTTFMDWKAEIDYLIDSGIDESNFCIDDSHKHSTPLAGYVGAHMIYRAIFNKVPTVKDFAEVSRGQIAFLGEYSSTGRLVFIDEDDIYYIKQS